MNLNEAILRILYEFIQQKNKVGSGYFKKVYPLKTHPDYVVKVVNKSDIKYLKTEERFYKEHPDLMAKIIKVNEEKGYMIQERLDTNLLFDEMERIIDEVVEKFPNLKSELDIRYDDILVISEYKDWFRQIKDMFANKLFSFIDKVNEINLHGYGSVLNYVDLKLDNIGLDKQGNIKLLDL